MEKQPVRGARSWLFGALFVWALTAAVAITAMSGRKTSDASNAAAIKALAAPSLGADASADASADAMPQIAAVKLTGRVAPVGQIDWQPSFEAAMQRARVEKKPIMIDFYTDWCSWCKELDARVYPDKAVVEEAEKWVSIRIDAEKRPDVAGAYGVTGYPTIIFAHSTGKPLDVTSGFSPAPEFLEIMQKARAKWTP